MFVQDRELIKADDANIQKAPTLFNMFTIVPKLAIQATAWDVQT